MDYSEIIKLLFGTKEKDRTDALFPLLYNRSHYLLNENIEDNRALEFLEDYFKELVGGLLFSQELELIEKGIGINVNEVSI
jgi:hypothetical protein